MARQIDPFSSPLPAKDEFLARIKSRAGSLPVIPAAITSARNVVQVEGMELEEFIDTGIPMGAAAFYAWACPLADSIAIPRHEQVRLSSVYLSVVLINHAARILRKPSERVEEETISIHAAIAMNGSGMSFFMPFLRASTARNAEPEIDGMAPMKLSATWKKEEYLNASNHPKVPGSKRQFKAAIKTAPMLSICLFDLIPAMSSTIAPAKKIILLAEFSTFTSVKNCWLSQNLQATKKTSKYGSYPSPDRLIQVINSRKKATPNATSIKIPLAIPSLLNDLNLTLDH